MSEILNVKKTGKSKFGFYLLTETEEGDKFRSTSEAVSRFLEKQTPCKVEVVESDEKGGITRVKVVGKSEQKDVQGELEDTSTFKSGNEYKENYWDWKRENDLKTQENIISQFCVREAIRLIEVNNNSFPENKVLMTKNNVYTHALIIKGIVNDLVKLGSTEE
jgi:hypothetical protein